MNTILNQWNCHTILSIDKSMNGENYFDNPYPIIPTVNVSIPVDCPKETSSGHAWLVQWLHHGYILVSGKCVRLLQSVWSVLLVLPGASITNSGQTILLNDRSDRSKPLRSIIDRKANLRWIICRSFIIVKWTGLLLWKQYIIITVRLGIWDNFHLL